MYASIYMLHTRALRLRVCVENYKAKVSSREMSWPEVNPLIFREREKESREIMCTSAVLAYGSRNVALECSWSLRKVETLTANNYRQKRNKMQTPVRYT